MNNIRSLASKITAVSGVRVAKVKDHKSLVVDATCVTGEGETYECPIFFSGKVLETGVTAGKDKCERLAKRLELDSFSPSVEAQRNKLIGQDFDLTITMEQNPETMMIEPKVRGQFPGGGEALSDDEASKAEADILG